MEVVLNLLANPIFMRAAAVCVIAGIAFVAGILGLRLLRRRIVEEDLTSGPAPQDPLFSYSAVIQQLKQQKFALESEQQAQRRKAKLSEHITAALVANLPCGVLFIAPNGLVKQANAAARQILGFASPLGMNAEEILRGRTGSVSGAAAQETELFRKSLREDLKAQFDIDYKAPSGEWKFLQLAIVPLRSPSGERLGVACAITDHSALAGQRQAEILQRENSVELALELRTSLAMIRECADRMCDGSDEAQRQELARDIADVTERLERLVGGFLAGDAGAMAASAKA